VFAYISSVPVEPATICDSTCLVSSQQLNER
jgi:hypothetical protein